MPERRRRALALLPALVGPLLLVGLVRAPGAVAQDADGPRPAPTSGPWQGSRWVEPESPLEVTSAEGPTVAVQVDLVLRKATATSEILQASFTVVDDPGDEFEPVATCETEPVVVPSDGTSAADASDRLAARVAELALPCNGRWFVRATAEASDAGIGDVVLDAVHEVRLPAPPVEVFSATTTETGEVRVDYETVDDLPPDALGYRVERAGPRTDDGFGSYEAIAVRELGDRPQVTDAPEPGEYRYRVRTLRAAVDGPVASSLDGLEPATVEVVPVETTTTTASTTPPPRIGGAIPRVPTSRPTVRLSPPTTRDTGFLPELDFGGVTLPSTTPPGTAGDDLAGEELGGQSIVRDEDDDGLGAGLLVPAAGALVLLGWAGHLVYVNRLARVLDLEA